MSCSRLLYKATTSGWRRLCFYFDHFVTYIKFKVFCDSFGDFDTAGIPFINTSIKGGSIKIGSGFKMNNGYSRNQLGYSNNCILHAICGNIIIGDNVGISQTTIIAYDADVYIGSNTICGGGVKIFTTDFHSLNYLERRDVKANELNKKSMTVTIGEDCFIGAGTIILKGVNIGSRTIIGAGSVVTKSIPNDSFAAGNPCRVKNSKI